MMGSSFLPEAMNFCIGFFLVVQKLSFCGVGISLPMTPSMGHIECMKSLSCPVLVPTPQDIWEAVLASDPQGFHKELGEGRGRGCKIHN